ncbi:MAG: hypothetical protein AAF560_26615 [Acidobacteriota bacterium]
MKRSQGFVLITVLVLIAMLMAGGTLLAMSLQYRMWVLRQEAQDIHLSALVDAGLAQALDRFSLSHFWSGAPEHLVGEGTVEVVVEMGDRPLTRIVRVTATHGVAGRSVEAVVQLDDFVPPRVLEWHPITFQP